MSGAQAHDVKPVNPAWEERQERQALPRGHAAIASQRMVMQETVHMQSGGDAPCGAASDSQSCASAGPSIREKRCHPSGIRLQLLKILVVG